MKSCTKCTLVKATEQFVKNVRSADGYERECKDCRNLYQRARTDVDHRDRALRSRYGLCREDFDVISASQSGLCAICSAATALHVDHDHSTGEVRGLLCRSCNTALGLLRDNLHTLREAVRYLEADHMN